MRDACPICGRPVKVRVSKTVRGPGTTTGSHRPGERRTRREILKTCGRQRCRVLLRARSILAAHER